MLLLMQLLFCLYLCCHPRFLLFWNLKFEVTFQALLGARVAVCMAILHKLSLLLLLMALADRLAGKNA